MKGYGAALHSGILAAKFKHVLFADADLSYSFTQIGKFLPKIKQDFDLILGSRFQGKIAKGAMPFLHQYFGTPVLTLLIRIIYRIPTTDCNSGMRVVKKSFYKKLLMKNSGMEWASELLIKTVLNGGKYIEVPINFLKDKRLGKPHLNSWSDGWRHLKVVILLKPSLLLSFAFLFLLMSLVLAYENSFFTLSISAFLLAEFLYLSYLALRKLEAAINKIENPESMFVDSLPLVPMGILITVLGISQLFYLPAKYDTLKLIIFFQALFYDLSLFFIETIKTHLINRLPDSK